MQTCGILDNACAPNLVCDQTGSDNLLEGEGYCRTACTGIGGSCDYDGVGRGAPRQPAPVMGRPFLMADGTPLLASVQNSSEGSSWCDSELTEQEVQLSSADTNMARDRWIQDARAEHASVAAFSRFSLQLMAVAAPADLVAAAHLAAVDEVKHAQLCFGLAKTLSRSDDVATPGPFTIPSGSVEITSDVGTMVFHTALEGCVGETVSVVQALFELQTLPLSSNGLKDQVGEVLTTIFEDEARHAALAWRTLLWAVGENSPDAEGGKAQVKTVIEILKRELSESSSDIPVASAFAGAPLSPATKQALREVTLKSLIVPSLYRLLQDTDSGLTVETSNTYVKHTFEQIQSNLE